MAARLWKFTAVFLLVAVVAPLRRAAAATYDVGDSFGWNVPPNSSTYSDWASNKTFHVGDNLVFKFAAGAHDVTEVTKAAFDSCSGSNPISVVSSSPATVTLTAAGDRHFICTFPSHCSFGQKLSVTVKAQSSPPPAAAPSPPPKHSTPVSPSPSPSNHSGRPPKASPPTATPPPENAASPPPSDVAPSTPSATTAPPPPNSASSLGGFSLFFSAVLAIVMTLIY